MGHKESVLAFFARAQKYSLRRFYRQEDREDFVSFAVEKYLKSGRGNLSWHLTDYFRAMLGDSRKPHAEERHQFNYALSFDSLVEGQQLVLVDNSSTLFHELNDSMGRRNAKKIRLAKGPTRP